jgi:hypothetical protein
LAQTVTAGANGLLIAVGSFNLTCSAASVEIQGVRPDGLPNGTTVATGGFQSNAGSSSGIEITPALPMTIGSQFAIVFSSPASCNVNSAPSTFDGYFAGDGYGEVGGAWVPLLQTDSKYDIPVRSLILPDVPVGFLRFSRSSHNATLLNDGRILVTGGSTPERFNPATGDSTLTGNLNTVNRSGFTATRLNDGTVLIAGGQAFLNNVTTYLTQAEIFDPATGSFTVLTSPMNFGRTAHTATLLSDGTVLIAGGFGPSTIRQAEIFNPVSQTFTVVGDMVSFRNSHTATKLQDGRVLIVGGNTSAPAELYDPISHTFSATGSTVEPRSSGFTATLLADGRVLVTGGFGVVTPAVRNSAEIYDPATGAFTITGSMSIPRASHTAVLLADGSVLVSGGRDLSNASRTLSRHERFVPASGTFVPAGGMVTQRSNHTATRLSDGRVVILGGFSNGGTLPGQTAEIYDPATALALTGVPLADAQLLDPYTAGLVASGGSGTGYSIVRVSGSLPPGLTYNSSTFTIGGGGQAPTAAGIYTVGMRITDSLGRTGV